MSSKLDSPVNTQMAVEVLNKSQSEGEFYEDNIREQRHPASPVGIRRVFVQTDSGCVLGMELDRRDNAHTVKRRLQHALNVPTEDSSLTFGDKILSKELDAVRSDSPLRLTRNLMHRSSSTPCLSPCEKTVLARDESGIIQILGQSNCFGRVTELVKEMLKAIENGVDPIPVSGGLGGVYYFKNCQGESVAIVKPTDEEPYAPNNPKGLLGKALGQSGLKGSVRVGETGYREVAAYLLDYDHFSKVPVTALVKISHSIFNVNDSVNGNKLHNTGVVHKIASLQQFIHHDFDASDHGTSNFSVAAVHRIGILDIRIFNTDRHAGNILVRKLDAAVRFGEVELIPIDHGLCLPECLEDPYFEWIHWPQASIPFSVEVRDYIMKLDPSHDCEMLRAELPMIREACLRILVLCTTFLKGATAFGLCLAEIGQMMSRQYCKYGQEPSELESLCMEAMEMIEEREEVVLPDQLVDEALQFNMDYGEKVPTDRFSDTRVDLFKCTDGWNPLEMEQCVSEEENVGNGEKNTSVDSCGFQANPNRLPTVRELSESSSSKISLVQKDRPKPKPAPATVPPRRSAEELHLAITGSVNLADITEKEWVLFLDQFQQLLAPAFANRKSGSLRGRLGTSCQF